MSLLLIAPDRDMQPWKQALLDTDPDINVEIWPDVANDQRVQFAVSWRHPSRVLQRYPNLKAVSSLGAGVNHILDDETAPKDLPVCRVVSPSLAQQMKEYVFSAVLNHHRNLHTYFRQQGSAEWQEHEHTSGRDVHIGVMGLGALGRPIASALAQFGYRVSGWSRSAKEIDDVQTFAGAAELHSFAQATQILICVLPLTGATEGILDLELFKKLQRPAYLINVARGEHLVEEDLIYALDKEWLTGACLDVFSEEPLPQKHAFWNRAAITITPHISSISKPAETAPQIVENYKRVLSGQPLQHKVDRAKGY